MKTLIVSYILVFTVSLQFEISTGQGMNLLQNYIKNNFKNHFPSNIRSYTLYGNGQNRPADVNAGLPYPYKKSGKVHNMMYSASQIPALAQPKSYSYHKTSKNPDFSQAKPFTHMDQGEGFIKIPMQIPQSRSPIYYNDLQGNIFRTQSLESEIQSPAQDKMSVESERLESVKRIPLNVFENENARTEISMQSSMSFQRR